MLPQSPTTRSVIVWLPAPAVAEPVPHMTANSVGSNVKGVPVTSAQLSAVAPLHELAVP